MRPTVRAVVLFAAGIPFTAAVLMLGEDLWVFGATYIAAALILLGVDAVLALPARRLSVEVHVPALAHIGAESDLVLEVETPGWPRRTLLRLLVDVAAPLLPSPQRYLVVHPGKRDTLTLPLVAERRGTGTVERLWVRWHGPLALMAKQRVFALSREIAIVPNIRAVRQAAVQFSTRDAFYGVKVSSQVGEGSEFESLREYVPGLNSRDIDWKRSARHRELVCKEFRVERDHNIILAFDTGHLMREPLGDLPRLDHAINAGLLLAYLSLRSGDRVGVFAFDDRVRTYVAPAPGVHAFDHLQHAAAGLDYGEAETNFTLGLATLSVRLQRRSLIVLFTEFVDTLTAELMVENVARMARRHLVMFVTMQDPMLRTTLDARPRTLEDIARAVVADDFIRDRLVVLERLRRFGVQGLDVPGPMLATDLINRYLTIKRKEMI